MTDPDVPPTPNPEPPAILLPAPETASPSAEPPPPRGRGGSDALPWLCGIGFLILAGGIGYVGWLSQQRSAELAALQDRVVALAQRPPAPVDLRPLEARVAALEHRAAPDLAALQAQVTALQQRQAPNLAPLQAQLAAVRRDQAASLATVQARLATLEKQVAAADQTVAGASQLGDRLNALAAQMKALALSDQTATEALAHRVDAAEGRLAALEHSTAQLTQSVQGAARLARIEAAQQALSDGRPLGDIPGAPPAVAHFATAAPPTEAALRLEFPKAAEAALAAARPDAGNSPFLRQMMTRAEDLVTVRQGDRVLVGNPAAGLLARAHTALDAGDLSAAVAAVSGLTGPAASAMAGWLAQARALLAARAGLAELAAHG